MISKPGNCCPAHGGTQRSTDAPAPARAASSVRGSGLPIEWSRVMRNLILPLAAVFVLCSSVAWALALLDLLK